MKYTEVNEKDGIQFTDDGFGPYEIDVFPVDEWRCAECDQPIGWVLWDGQYGEAGLSWYATYIAKGSDPLADDTRRLCECCVPEEAVA